MYWAILQFEYLTYHIIINSRVIIKTEQATNAFATSFPELLLRMRFMGKQIKPFKFMLSK